MSDYNLNLRRYRQTKAVRDMFATVEISASNLIQPYFVYQDLSESIPLPSIAGQNKHNLESLLKEVSLGLRNGVTSILLFFIPSSKGSCDFDYNFGSSVLKGLRAEFGDEITIFTDTCLCSHTESGHCGILENGEINNDKSVRELMKQAVAYASAGADCISPSDMMDNRIRGIRRALDEAGLSKTMIMSYSTKFSSNFYGPFRDAAESTPSSGDRKSYQIDFRNESDAMLSSLRDMEQGADILMVKPAGAYLDIINKIKSHQQMGKLPLAAYQVSGEYQALHIMAEQGLLDFDAAYLETLYAIRRSGAELIITYGANKFNQIIKR
ncbi:MAG: porphobilinogen synthase [Bacteriovoracaceae bacterium]|nr:porphobilinogen synthase [Bacteriovoracaceae bacterium]